ncbi:hypothetical protein GF325_16675 [Candidatus Bathyarchaeota archaeon]|nr:hypothetical protein [Candidatus Bathyarchaeota archaeon]
MPLDDFLTKATGKTGTASRKDSKEHEHMVNGSKGESGENDSQEQRIEALKRILAEKNLISQESHTPMRVECQAPENGNAIEKDIFLVELLKFASWIKKRSYLQGDIHAAKRMLRNIVNLDPDYFKTKSEMKARTTKVKTVKDALAFAREWVALHPGDALLTKQEWSALEKKRTGKKLTSTDYRHLRILRDKVTTSLRKIDFFKFLDRFL